MPRLQRRSNETVSISNPEKVLYPAGKFTKADAADYYSQIARALLPHLKDRPITLKRFPNGVHGEAFYEKDAPGFTPRWIRTFPVPRREGGPDINYILIDDVRSLKWVANTAALELHPFLHRVPHLDQPTHIVFDLDPGEGTNILQCAEVAFLLREVVTKLGLKCFPKVSGSKGIQLYLPLNTKVTYAATQPLARAIAEWLEKTYPDRIVADMAKNLRVGKVFIDWSQNADHKTTVAVYSLRAKRARPYVSVPIRWQELTTAIRKSEIELLDFEPAEALQRWRRSGDLFAPVLNLKQEFPRQFAFLKDASAPKPKPPAALRHYSAKRDFGRTTEPSPAAPRRSRQGSRRRFVVQKHAASHLHYDFRLEMHDVLKSWAIPKGIPLNENEIHTAFQTEDHPLDYLEFEGIIPRGEYGGGTVMVWDIGNYELIDGNYWKGFISIFLSGKKLKGEWTLQRVDNTNDKPKWLLRKTGEKAKPIPQKRERLSALTGRTIDEIAGDQSRIWMSNRGGGRVSRASKKNAAHVGKAKLPEFIKPMKATAVTELPEGEEWIYEVKWDGYRAVAVKAGDDVRLLSLKGNHITADFPAVVQAVRGVGATVAAIDGEVVALDRKGCPSFQALQNRASSEGKWRIVYYGFDLLNFEGEVWTQKPLCERKRKLRNILAKSQVLYNDELAGSVSDIVRTIRIAGLEGVVAKRRDSKYRAGSRVTSWVKLKVDKSQEFVLGGYKPDAGTFQSILVGYYDAKKLVFAGKVRQGFNPAARHRLLQTMRPLLVGKCPFTNLPTSRKSHFGEGITSEEMADLCWLKPRLVAQISFTEWTRYGLLRHASFEGLRDDKEPGLIVREL